MQIICARLKILAMPPGRGVNPGLNAAEGEVDPGADLAPCILKGTWEPGVHQQQFTKRLRYSLVPCKSHPCADGSIRAPPFHGCIQLPSTLLRFSCLCVG